MLTYFIRHTERLDIDDATRQHLWDARKIAVHYPHDKTGKQEHDSVSLQPDNYNGPARIAIGILKKLAEKGGYVCAQYSGFEDALIGRIEPNSAIELVTGKWGKRNGNAERLA